MADTNQIETTLFNQLRLILYKYRSTLTVTTDTAAELYLNTEHIMENGKPQFSAAVKINKHYVSFHLMPMYVNPSLLTGMSPKLKQRMQGKILL